MSSTLAYAILIADDVFPSSLSRVLKETVELKKALAMDSDLHKREDISELKKLVAKVEDLIRTRMPVGPSEDIERDLVLGYKGIVMDPKPPKPKLVKRKAEEKPVLNTEDIWDVEI